MNVYEEIDKFVNDVFSTIKEGEHINCIYNCGKSFSTQKAYLSHLVDEHIDDVKKKGLAVMKYDEDEGISDSIDEYINDVIEPYIDGMIERDESTGKFVLTDIRNHKFIGDTINDVRNQLFEHWDENPEEWEEFESDVFDVKSMGSEKDIFMDKENYKGRSKPVENKESVEDFLVKAAKVINFDTMEDGGKIYTHKEDEQEESEVYFSQGNSGNEIQFYIDEILTHPVVVKSGERYYRCPICAKKGKTMYYKKMSDAVHHFYVEHVEDDDVNKEAEALNNILYTVGVKKEKYPWKQCIHDQMYGKHHYSKEVAQKICGAIKYRYGKALKEAFPDRIFFDVEKDDDTTKTNVSDMPNPGIDVKPKDRKNIARRIVD